MARTVTPTLVENGPKLRVLITVIGEWPKTAKNRGEPRKMTYSSETEFFWGGPNEKVVAPDILVICPVDKIAITIQKIYFWPQISKFLGSKSTFSPLAANWSLIDQCFRHEKGVSLVS